MVGIVQAEEWLEESMDRCERVVYEEGKGVAKRKYRKSVKRIDEEELCSNRPLVGHRKFEKLYEIREEMIKKECEAAQRRAERERVESGVDYMPMQDIPRSYYG